MSTLEALKDAIDTAIYAYGNTLIDEMEAAGVQDDLRKWLSLSLKISLQLDEVINKEEQ